MAKPAISGAAIIACATIIAFDDSAETLQQFTTDTALLRRQIDSIVSVNVLEHIADERPVLRSLFEAARWAPSPA